MCLDCHGRSGEGDLFKAINGQCDDVDCQGITELAGYLEQMMPLGNAADCDLGCAIDIAAFMIAGFPRESDVTPQDGVFSCRSEDIPDTPAWARLSKTQYRNSLSAVASELLENDGVAAAIIESLWETFDHIPEEVRPVINEDLHGTYRRLNQNTSQSHAEAWFEMAENMATQLTHPSRIEQTIPCYNNMAIDSCVSEIISRAGRFILRRPINAEDISLYSPLYRASNHEPESYRDILIALLSSPEFIYHINHGQGNEESALLSGPELANKLSYHLLDSPPDSELRALADSGALLNASTYETQALRLIGDYRTGESTQNFYREWLKLENIRPLHEFNSSADFITFALGIAPTYQTHTNMMNEVLGLLEYGTWQLNWSVEDILTTQLILPDTSDLAAIYGTTVSDSPMISPSNDRPGLFTRPAFLSNAGINTRPILKGVFLRHTLMCDEIPAPPDNATDDLPPLDPHLNTRERVEAITERPGTSCATCHQALINGLGFASENYDALGRVRQSERIIDESGAVIFDSPISTRSTPNVRNNDSTSTNDMEGVMDLVAESGKVEACLARNYFRYTFGRFEDTQKDGCALEQIRQGLVDGTLQDMLLNTVNTTAFKSRTFVGEAQ